MKKFSQEEIAQHIELITKMLLIKAFIKKFGLEQSSIEFKKFANREDFNIIFAELKLTTLNLFNEHMASMPQTPFINGLTYF